MEIVESNYHLSFFKGTDMKSVFEFSLPEEEQFHYEALNGHKYRELITRLEIELSDAVKAAHGTPEADYLNPVLKRIHDLAVEIDVKLNRK